MLILIMVLAFVHATFAQTVWDGTANTDWYDASQNEFTITTAEELAGLAKLVKDGNYFEDKIIKLGADIMLNDTTDWENWETTPPNNTWVPIYSFIGTFDGNGYIVSGVYTQPVNSIKLSSNYTGLFGAVNGTIENLGITASYIEGINELGSCAGGLVGILNENSIISNSYFIGVVTGPERAGGLAGCVNNMCTINNSYSNGTVTASNAGGLVGLNSGSISSSYFNGTVIGKFNAGGLVGRNSGSISSSYFNGTVTTNGHVSGSNAGGLVGTNVQNSSISSSYSIGAVTESYYVGGLAGHNSGSISSSYFNGTAKGYAYVGGLAGKSSYAYSSISNSYYDEETSGLSIVVGEVGGGTVDGKGKTTAQMKQQSTFVNWDFTNIWGIDSRINCGYPYLLGFEYSEECNIEFNPVPIINLSQITNGQIIVQATNNGIVLKNLPSNAKVEVYGLNGKLITTSHSPLATSLTIPVQTKGMYIVKINNTAFRVPVFK
ncbi:MAG: T9SS type A sorting domain-containing protein [Fibromonadaceae bacterium]|jgi:hypothetical protein|nr:T9SS type A sorting domain-containing protein [Fibromonadaceae bacterium]